VGVALATYVEQLIKKPTIDSKSIPNENDKSAASRT
jgi:hypothetical protein